MKLKNRLRKHNTHIYTNTPDTHKYTDIYRQNREMLTSKNVTNHPTPTTTLFTINYITLENEKETALF